MVEVDDLRQICPLDRGAEFDLALAGLLAEEHLQKRGLSGAVVAEERHTLAAAHLQLDVGKQRSSIERL